MTERIKLLSDDTMQDVSGGKYSGSVFLYTVQEGDTLSMLAQRFGTTVAVIGELNGIKRASSVYAGVKLLIPLKS